MAEIPKSDIFLDPRLKTEQAEVDLLLDQIEHGAKSQKTLNQLRAEAAAEAVAPDKMAEVIYIGRRVAEADINDQPNQYEERRAG